jgi:hypothetical protein
MPRYRAAVQVANDLQGCPLQHIENEELVKVSHLPDRGSGLRAGLSTAASRVAPAPLALAERFDLSEWSRARVNYISRYEARPLSSSAQEGAGWDLRLCVRRRGSSRERGNRAYWRGSRICGCHMCSSLHPANQEALQMMDFGIIQKPRAGVSFGTQISETMEINGAVHFTRTAHQPLTT